MEKMFLTSTGYFATQFLYNCFVTDLFPMFDGQIATVENCIISKIRILQF